MSALRFSDHSLKSIYLSNRSFRVNVQGKYSCIAKIDCGVPQRSILGPLLFLLYVNNMNQAVDCDLFIIQLQIDTSYSLIPQFRGNLVGEKCTCLLL